MKKVFIIVIFAVVLIAVLLGMGFYFAFYSEGDIVKVIDSYICARYDGISTANIEDSYRKQAVFYSEDLKEEENWVSNTENIEAAKEYFARYGYTTDILTSSTERLDKGLYQTTLFVLYRGDNSAGDNFVKYVYRFSVVKDLSSGYKFDRIEAVTNEVTYLEGKDYYIKNNEVFLLEEDHLCEAGHEH